MSEQRLAPESSAKVVRVNLHHNHTSLTFMMMVDLPLFLTICLVLVLLFPPRQRSHYLRKQIIKSRCFLML